MRESPTLEVILPQRDMDKLSRHLVELTEAIDAIDPALVAHGVFGGEHGYGGHWDSAVFMMRPFCWCDRDDCRWCSDEACGCDYPAPLYFFDKKTVSSDEYWRANERILAPLPWDVAKPGTSKYAEAQRAFDASIVERDRRLKTIYPAIVHTCEPRGMMADRPEGLSYKPSQSAPNFWHKPSGLKVWWYKYIGRDQEVVGPATPDISNIFAECLKDVQERAA